MARIGLTISSGSIGMTNALRVLDGWLESFSRTQDFGSRMRRAFGDAGESPDAAKLRTGWANGDYALPRIELADTNLLHGADGAYAAATDTIFLSAALVAERGPEAVARVLLEEYGHAVDRALNGSADSAGDEGELFARLVADGAVSDSDEALLKAQDDHAVAVLDGVPTAVELAEPLEAVTHASTRHVFSIDDILGNFDGTTYADDPTIIDLDGTPTIPTLTDKAGTVLSPIDNEFGFIVSDFEGAEDKVRNNDYAEGWVGNIVDANLGVVGIATVNAVTDSFKSGQPFGTWAAGLGGNTVKASTEHYNVMAHLLSDQQYPGDPNAVYPLDNALRVRGTFNIGGTDVVDPLVSDLLAQVGDVNGDGTLDVADVLTANESTTNENIAYSTDYSVTLKDDGKLLYRWGTEVKRPNDIRIDAKLELPEEWLNAADRDGDQIPDVQEMNGGLGYRIVRAELIVAHDITNNPNDQIRPEDWENEGATGRGPSYYVVVDPNDPTNELWVSPVDSYDGSGTFLPSYFKLTDTGAIDLAAGGMEVRDPAGNLVGYRNVDGEGTLVGTVLRDRSLIAKADAAGLTFSTSDLDAGLTNAWYTTTDRDPFEWSYDMFAADPYRQSYVGFRSAEDAAAAGYTEDDLVSGPRWRMTSNKFGQDVPGVEIPLVANSQPPYQKDNIRYEVGTATVTTINLLDFEDLNKDGIRNDSPLLYSTGWTQIDAARLDLNADGLIDAGWQKVNGSLGAGDALPTGAILSAVTPNGLTLTPDFLDIAFYLKGDRQDSAKIYNTQLLVEYEADPTVVTGYDFAAASDGAGIFAIDPAAVIPDIAQGDGGSGEPPAPIDPDVDQALNTTPDYRASIVFSTANVTGTFDGLTQGRVLPGATPVIDFSATPQVTKEGVALYPINSEFGYNVTDFVGAVEKDFVLDPAYAEGWAGDLKDGNGSQLGLVVSDSPTDTFLTQAKLGTWLVGMGGDAVKADTEHYSVMQAILSDQKYPGDPDALYPLDDNLKVIGGLYDGQFIADILPTIGDANGDGAIDIRDVLLPNESSVTENIAVSNDYSVTLKDDGKLLYRWGNLIKKPNDIRIEAELPLPKEWMTAAPATPTLLPLFRITQAELVVRHTITNNPNDQFRPEDYENEAATGTLPTYTVLPDGKWVTTDDYYAGDGTLYPAGTVLKDPTLVTAVAGSTLAQIGAMSEDLIEGYTNAWYTTMNREPFEPVLDAEGGYEVGARWRLKADKFGQDLPGVDIPADPSLPPPPTKDEIKYEVGLDTQTVINLLDWEGASPLQFSAGWQNAAGTVSVNGLNRTENFDIAFYVKGDIKPATLYGAELVMSYDEVAIAAAGASVTGTTANDVLAGQGGNTFTGLAGEDIFVLSYGVTDNATVVASTVNDFEMGIDKLGLVGLALTELDFAAKVTQTVVGSDLQVNLEGNLLATLLGVGTALELEDFLIMSQPAALVSAPDATNDVNGDGTSDILFQNTTSDLALYWKMQGGAFDSSVAVGTPAPGLDLIGSGDFNGDGADDMLLRDSATGSVVNWEMASGALGRTVPVGAAGTDWALKGAGDFNGDGTDDILFQNIDSNLVLFWQMSAGGFGTSVAVGPTPADWVLKGTGDFNGDGTDDILFQNSGGLVVNWEMANGSVGRTVEVAGAGSDWALKGTGDFNGDAVDDILFQNLDSGLVLNWQMANGDFGQSLAIAGAASDWSLESTGDYNGNGTDDILFRNNDTGLVLQWQMAGGGFASSVPIAGAGADWHLVA